MFRNNSEKRVPEDCWEEATEEAAEFFERKDKIEKVLIVVFTAAISAIIMGFVFGIIR